MAFWSGMLETITGHPAGAFSGMSMSDWFDNEKWQRMPRTWSGKMHPQGATEALRQRDLRTNRAGEPMYTNWYGQPRQQTNRLMDENPDMFAGVNQRAFDATTLANQRRRDALWPSGPTVVQAANLQYPGIGPNAGRSLQPDWAGASLTEDRDTGMGANRFLQLGDPRNIRSGPDLPPASMSRPLPGVGRDRPFPLADKKTVKKIFADPNKSNEIIETIEEKIPTGSAQWGNSRHPPNWQNRIDTTSLMNLLSPNAWKDVAKRKWLERQAARRTY